MIFRTLLIMVAVLVFAMAGCKKDAPPAEPAQAVEPAQVEVTAENLDSELDKMESQIDADLAAEE